MNINEILDQIKKSDDTQLSEIIQSVIRKYGVLHPGWEIIFLSLPRDDPEARRKCVEETVAFLYSISNIVSGDCHASVSTGSQ